MRRFICLTLFITCLLLCSCEEDVKDNVVYDMTTPVRLTLTDNPQFSGEVKLMQYSWHGWGIDTKSITGKSAASLVAQLELLSETDETTDKISDDSFNENSSFLPVERGTLWIEVNDDIYRVEPDFSKIYCVESHLGKGTVLAITEQFKRELINAWRYWPYDCWSGIYENNELHISHIYEAESNVQVIAKNIYVEKIYNPQNKITIELISSINQTITIYLQCNQTFDTIAKGDEKTVNLKANVPQTVELSFGGWRSTPYWVNIYAGNTKLTIEINP